MLGLNVQTRRVYEDDGRRYLVYRGETKGGFWSAPWRLSGAKLGAGNDTDFERDRGFVEEHKLAEGVDKIYVNGDSFIPKSEAVERLFPGEDVRPE